jgi:hypothetical protein
MWLNNVTEAQSVHGAAAGQEPWTAGGFYAVPVLAMALCLWNIRERRQVQAYGVLFVAAGFLGIALVQVRGAVFANLLSAIPMAALMADLRARANADQKNLRKGLAFAAISFVAVPFVWAFAGLRLPRWGRQGDGQGSRRPADEKEKVCTDADAMASLAQEPAGVVSGPSNLGAYSAVHVAQGPFGTLSPQSGRYADRTLCSDGKPKDAVKFLRGAGVTLVAFCGSDPQIGIVKSVAPEGLYAQLSKVSCRTGWNRCPAPRTSHCSFTAFCTEALSPLPDCVGAI